MPEVKIILAALGFLFIHFQGVDNINWYQKLVIKIGKPFTCAYCLSTWLGVVLSIWYCDLIYISLPIIYNKLRN